MCIRCHCRDLNAICQGISDVFGVDELVNIVDAIGVKNETDAMLAAVDALKQKILIVQVQQHRLN